MAKWMILISLSLLTACGSGDVRETLGLNRSSPDEFKVVSRPPLSVPPEFTLRPPAPGEPPLLQGSTQDEAKSLLFGGDKPASGTTGGTNYFEGLSTLETPYSSGVSTAVDPVQSSELESAAESKFLSNAGADKADPNIRSLLHEEKEETPTAADDASPLEKWLGIGGGEPVVDPKEEAIRIRQNKDEGKPVNEGEVKTVDPKKGSVLDKLF